MLEKLRSMGLVGIALMAAAFPSVSSAGGYNGLAKPYWYNGVLYISVVGMGITDSPACRTRSIVRLQEGDYNDPAFKGKYAMLLAAWYAQQHVYLGGTGQCTGEGDELIFVVSPS
jgi:hypothetical protein